MALMKALKFAQKPYAIVCIFRLSFPLLKSAGGLVSESKVLYAGLGMTWKEQKLEWHCKNGSIIKFYALPADLSELQGQAYTHTILDEGAEFQLQDILAIRGRMRSGRYQGKMSMLITANPSRQSWLYPWLKSCDFLDDEGIPKEGTENITKWYIILNSKIFWGNSPEELHEKHGAGTTLGVDFLPLSFRFIPMDIFSNPPLLKNNPQYLANLRSQSRVNQLRFLFGSWEAVAEGDSFIRREWFNYVHAPPSITTGRCRAWDTAASIPTESSPKCDATAGTKMSRDKMGMYYVEHCNVFRKLTDGVLREIADTARKDGLDVPVVLEKDTGAGGKIANAYFTRYLSEQGVIVRSVQMSGHSGKIQRFLPFAQMAEAGMINIVRYGDDRDDWIEPWLVELESFNGARGNHDDMVDSTASAFNTLCKTQTLPIFSIPNMTQSSPIPTI